MRADARIPIMTAIALAVLVGAGLLAAASQPAPYDLLIRNGRIVDGTGGPWFAGDVAIRGDAIADIAPAIDAPAAFVIASCGWDPSLAGRTLADLTTSRGHQPTLEHAADTTLWIVERGGCQGIFHAMSDEDLERIMRHPTTMVGSDGEVPIFGRASPHPRSYGTFARVLGR